MISRKVTLTINDANVALDKKIVVCKGDKGVVFNISLKTNVYNIGDEIVKARAIVQDPSGNAEATAVVDIADNVFALNLDDIWADGIDEAGKFLVQLQLFGATPADAGVTIQAFQFEVLEPIAEIPLS